VEKEQQSLLLQAIKQGIIQSAEDLAEGGLAVALAESVIRSENLGANVKVKGDTTVALFSESQSRFLVSVKEADVAKFESLGFNAEKLGSVTAKAELTIANGNDEIVVNEPVEELKAVWQNSIENSYKA